MQSQALVDAEPFDSDEVLVERARAHDVAAFEQLMRRHNERVYRVVRSVLRDRAEVEDVMQHAYLAAFVHLEQFEGAAGWSTWLCRIAINKALTRGKQRNRFVSLEADDESERLSAEASTPRNRDPESVVAERELGLIIQQAIDRLPILYRTALVLRGVQGMSTAETASVLGVAEEVVKTRLHRARLLLRTALKAATGTDLREAYAFGGERCNRIVEGVLASISLEHIAVNSSRFSGGAESLSPSLLSRV